MTKKPYTPLKKKTIKIAGLTYRIKYYTRPRRDDEQMDKYSDEYDPKSWVAGYADLDKRVIGIYRYLCPEEHDFTLLHEILHASMEACKTGEMFHEEGFIKPLSRILYGALCEAEILSDR